MRACGGIRRMSIRCHILITLVDNTMAADEVNWPSIAISWVFSVITFLAILGCYWLLKKMKKKKSKAENVKNFQREISVSEVSDMTRDSVVPLCRNTGYTRVPSRDVHINRRISDYVSIWCSKHNLTESIANNLRENGFRTQDQLESLRQEDVTTLALSTVAEQVQLRNVLEKIHRNDSEAAIKLCEDETDGKPKHREIPGSRQIPSRSNRSRSNSSERTLPQLSLTEENTALNVSTSPTSSLPFSPGDHSRRKLSFNGLLSDAGLYDLADNIGTEWRHLAAVLGVSKAQQDRLLHDNPNNTKQQIYDMLMLWRDYIIQGEKEEVKADLVKALQKIKRKDLADRILREQVHGSDPNIGVPYRMNSVV